MFPGVLSLLRPNEGRRQRTSYAGLSAFLTTSATPAQGSAPIGIELRRLLDALTQSGRELQGVADATLAGHLKGVLDGTAALSCRIAVVGQVKAGKSSFINALIQRADLLPTHVNPWTAVATRLHFGTPGRPVSGSDFTFFTADEWDALGRKPSAGTGDALEDGFAEMKQRAELRLGEQFHHLLGKAHFYQSVQPGILQNYLCAGPPVEEISRNVKPGRYADITKTANVYFPLPPMAVPAVLIDTPGTNDPTHLRHRITREIIEGADVYIVVITARQALAGSDLSLLELLRELEKQRIIIFINRIDELNERAVDADVLVRHVKAQVENVFPKDSIPIITGSAKWAGLATLDDVEQLRREAQAPALRAVAAQAGVTLPSPDAHGSDLPALQDCFRSTSGLNSVGRLLSLFMLSGFVSNHARGVARVLLSIAEISKVNACRQLKAMARALRDLHGNPALSRSAAETANALAVEINTLLETVGSGNQAPNEELAHAVAQGIARLQAAVAADIASFAQRGARAPEEVNAPAAASDIWTFDIQPTVTEEEGPTVTAGRSSWLSSVKHATFGFLRKTRVDSSAPQHVERQPSSTRTLSLTVPIMPAKDIAMTSGGAWWADGAAGKTIGSEPGQAAPQGAVPPVGNSSASEARTLAEMAEEVAKMGVTAIAPLPRLASRLHALQLSESRSVGAEKELLAKFLADYETAIYRACRALIAYEKVTLHVKGVFTPQTAGT
jgi:GTP-binding protein EngB required for normal cell division